MIWLYDQSSSMPVWLVLVISSYFMLFLIFAISIKFLCFFVKDQWCLRSNIKEVFWLCVGHEFLLWFSLPPLVIGETIFSHAAVHSGFHGVGRIWETPSVQSLKGTKEHNVLSCLQVSYGESKWMALMKRKISGLRVEFAATGGEQCSFPCFRCCSTVNVEINIALISCISPVSNVFLSVELVCL